MKLNGYTHLIGAVRRLCDVAQNLPLAQADTAFASALRETYDQLNELLAREETHDRTRQHERETAWATELYRLRYQEVFELNPDGSLITDGFGIILEASHAAATLLHSRKEFLVGKPLGFFVAEDPKAFYTYLQRLREGVADERWRGALKRARGTLHFVEAAVTSVHDEEGGPMRFLWLFRDLTATRQAEQTLREGKDFVNSLIETAQAIIIVLDEHGRIVRSNSYLHALSGYTAKELYNQSWSSRFITEGDGEAARQMLFDVLTFGTSGGSYSLTTKHGNQRIISWSAKAIGLVGTGPGMAAMLLVGHDITELQEAQKQALQMERLAAIGQAMTGLTHESRNALQRGMACLEILKLRLKDRPEDLDLLARMQRAHDDLLRLYEEVRAYGAPLHIERSQCHLVAVWREAWDQVTPQFPDKEATLCEEIAGAELWCLADARRLVQVFRNLLENSFAACPGPVQVGITCRETLRAGRPALQIAVRDNGPGLNEEQRQHIFEPFYTTKVKGTGLGTSIARRIVEAHGGEIALGNSAQPGTEIVITLPRSPL